MSSRSLEEIIEEVKTLSPDEQQQLREALAKESGSAEQLERARLADSIRGKYGNVLTSSEEFAARKAEEIVLEDRG
jgi:hypothetical protein